MRNYGTLTLTATSPVQSFTEPLSLGEVKTFLQLPARIPVDTSEDEMLEGFISGAREQAEICQGGKDLCPKQWDLALDTFPAAEIELRTPLVSVDLLKYRDSDGTWHTLTEGTDYIVDTARGLVMPPYNGSWPTFSEWPSSAVLARHTAGYSAMDAFWSDAGARIKVGMKILISLWFNNRLPFVTGHGAVSEYPFTLTACLSHGAVPRVRC